MATITPETAPQPEAPKLSFPARLIGVFFSPTETFADIVRRPAFIAPLILLALLALGVQLLVTQRIGMEQLIRSQIEKSPRAAQMSAEQMDQAVAIGLKFAKFGVYATPVISVVVFLAIAGILLGIANFVFSAEAQYKTMLAVTAYSFMPGIVNAILATVIVFLKQPSDIDVQNVVASNLGFLVDADAHKALHRLASSMDLFSFWQLALLGIGIAAATRFSFKKGLTIALIPWALWVLGAFALASLF